MNTNRRYPMLSNNIKVQKELEQIVIDLPVNYAFVESCWQHTQNLDAIRKLAKLVGFGFDMNTLVHFLDIACNRKES